MYTKELEHHQKNKQEKSYQNTCKKEEILNDLFIRKYNI